MGVLVVFLSTSLTLALPSFHAPRVRERVSIRIRA
jgi:hypothetical protein